MGSDVRSTHDFGFETPRTAQKRTCKRTRQIVHPVMLGKCRSIRVRVPADIAQNAPLVMDLSMCVNGGVDARYKVTLVAMEHLSVVRSFVCLEIMIEFEAFTALIASKPFVGVSIRFRSRRVLFGMFTKIS